MTRLAALLLLTAVGTGPAHALGKHTAPEDEAAHDAFVAELKAEHPVVALLPTEIPRVADRAVIAADFQQRLTAKLESNGYQVIPADVYGATYKALLLESGGIYDPITGERDEQKFANISQRARQTVADSHGATAFLESEILNREITFKGRFAVFGGVLSEAFAKGARSGFVSRELRAGVVNALYLRTTLLSPSGETLYENHGGIQLLTRQGASGLVAAEPPDALLKTADYNDEAVHLALRNMLEPAAALTKTMKKRPKFRVAK